jgi:hypothetical protein
VTRFTDAKPLPIDNLMSNLCEYVYSDYCGPKVKGIKLVLLDGDERLTELADKGNELYKVDMF